MKEDNFLIFKSLTTGAYFWRFNKTITTNIHHLNFIYFISTLTVFRLNEMPVRNFLFCKTHSIFSVHSLIMATYRLVPIRYFLFRRTDSSLPLHKQRNQLPVSSRSGPHRWQRLKSKTGMDKSQLMVNSKNIILFYLFNVKFLK